MWYGFLLPHSLILDVFVAAVLLMILGLTSLFFIQALVDSVFVLGRKPAIRSCLMPHLTQRIDAERMPGQHSHPLGLPLTMSLNDSKTFCILATVLLVAVSTYILMMDVSLPAPGDFRFQDGPIPVVIEVSGRIRDVYVNEGSSVHVGDVLVQLDSTDLLLRRSILESQIHSAELYAAEFHFKLSNLYRELRQLQMDLDRLTITSPADGEIASLEALHRGEAIQAGTAIAIIYPRKNEGAGGLASGAFRTR